MLCFFCFVHCSYRGERLQLGAALYETQQLEIKMAVQKSRKTRSKRGQRRSHDALGSNSLSVDQTTGEKHLRHHISADGFYKGEEIIISEEQEQEAE